MSDIFREVEEDVRRERFEKLWKAYGTYAIAFAALLLLAVAGYEMWQRYEANQRAQESDAFTAAQRISNPVQAATAFADLAKNTSGGYGLLTKLSQANALYASGQTKPAIDLYKEIAGKDNSEIGAVARLRAAWALADISSRSDLVDLLAPLDTPSSAWRQMAQEILAFADYRGLRLKQAQAEYEALADDIAAPDALRNRAKAMSDFLAQGAGADFGTVPPPQPAAPGALPATAATPPAATAQ